MLSNISQFVKGAINWFKNNFDTVIITIIIALSILFSFALGYIISEYKHKEPIIIEQNN